MNNLFISFQLNNPDTNNDTIEQFVASLGNSTNLFSGCWYVNSPLSASDAIKKISRLLSKEDVLVIADTNNNEGTWFNLEEKRAQRIRQNWRM